jgi:acyl-coenzyme A synthetase/AMP-(fatty) acid ligase
MAIAMTAIAPRPRSSSRSRICPKKVVNYVEALQMIRFFQVASATVATIQLQGMLEALGDQLPPPSLTAVGVTGSKFPLKLLNEGRARLSSHIFGAYGATEMGTLSIASPAELAEDEGAAGRIVPRVEIELVDELGKAVSPGTDGILRVRSPEQALYVDDNGNAVDSAHDGWFTSGDVGRIGPGRKLFITGRSSEIINRGGVVTTPDFVEDTIRLDARISDVCVVGNPSASGIDEIWAAVVAKGELDTTDLAAAIRLRLQERAPDRYFIVEKIPRNENGKVMRNALREMLSEKT